MRRTKLDSLKTREALLASARTLFLRSGVARTTISDICASAEVSRGAFYFHFRNKSALLTVMAASTWDLYSEILDGGCGAEDEGFLDDLELRTSSFIRKARDDDDIRLSQKLILRCERTQDTEAFLDELAINKARFMARLADTFEAVIAGDRISRRWTAQEASDALLCIILGSAYHGTEDEGSADRPETGAKMVGLLFSDLRAMDAR